MRPILPILARCHDRAGVPGDLAGQRQAARQVPHVDHLRGQAGTSGTRTLPSPAGQLEMSGRSRQRRRGAV